jgi:fructose-bisphosphate aldolase / 6-deoxy-5-ketofructose 1-phosphate synthase
MKNEMKVPASIPEHSKETYIQNYLKATKESGNLFLFAGDQKIEHLNKDFYGKDIAADDATPQHLFEIASKAGVGAFATQLGLISLYGNDYKDINYVVKLNSKTDLVPIKQAEALSLMLYSVDDVVDFREESKLNIVGVGYTIYLGSEYETQMLQEAAQVVLSAHQNGLLAVLWIYPRGKAIKNERDENLIAGAAGVAACLGADFVKVNPPDAKDSMQSAQMLKQATMAAGRTKVICAGGKKEDEQNFLERLYNQIHVGEVRGCAVGRNIHQKNLNNAIKFCKAISAILIDGKDLETAKKYLE